jgi:hypothetical protein
MEVSAKLGAIRTFHRVTGACRGLIQQHTRFKTCMRPSCRSKAYSKIR